MINKWLCDRLDSAHMTHRLINLEQGDEDDNSLLGGASAHMEVADGHIIQVPSIGEVVIHQ
jgi:hypothetical protein